MLYISLPKAEEKKAGPPPAAAAAGGPQAKGGKEGSAYIAPALRDGGNRKGETMAMGRRSKIQSLHSSLFHIIRTTGDVIENIHRKNII